VISLKKQKKQHCEIRNLCGEKGIEILTSVARENLSGKKMT
jgi:hypothetical protein